MIGWAILAMWLIGAGFAYRPIFRVMWEEGDGWGFLAVCALLFVPYFALLSGPCVPLWLFLRPRLDARTTPDDIGRRIAGEPTEDKIERLERENARLERKLGIGQGAGAR